MTHSTLTCSVFVALLTLANPACAQTSVAPDITQQPTLYVVPYAHLDTQWRWEYPQVISEYLLKTMRVNFHYIEKYPHYVFNWTGSNRYRLMKEYFPADYAKVKQYVAKGNWFPAGSSVEEGDVNLPSAESIFRRSSTATPIFATTSARLAPNSCYRTALDFLPLSPPSWRTQDSRVLNSETEFILAAVAEAP